jgi:hypothetical protein
VDSEDGTVKEVAFTESYVVNRLTRRGHAVALQSDTLLAVATDRSVVGVESGNNKWKQMGNYNSYMNIGHGKTVVALATREGKTFALVKTSAGAGAGAGVYVIEEVYWGYDGIWNSVVLAFVMFLCFCFVALMFISSEYERRAGERAKAKSNSTSPV